jgi:hypothetical protein
MRRREPVTGLIRAAIDASRAEGRLPRRHSADVTADRLVDHSVEWEGWTDRERDALGVVIYALREFGEGRRAVAGSATPTEEADDD